NQHSTCLLMLSPVGHLLRPRQSHDVSSARLSQLAPLSCWHHVCPNVCVRPKLRRSRNMSHKYLAFILAVVLSQALGAGVVCAQTYTDNGAQAVEQNKSKVARMGTGEEARVTVRLKNGQKLKGYRPSAGEQLRAA